MPAVKRQFELVLSFEKELARSKDSWVVGRMTAWPKCLFCMSWEDLKRAEASGVSPTMLLEWLTKKFEFLYYARFINSTISINDEYNSELGSVEQDIKKDKELMKGIESRSALLVSYEKLVMKSLVICQGHEKCQNCLYSVSYHDLHWAHSQGAPALVLQEWCTLKYDLIALTQVINNKVASKEKC